jgi:hypothetical protein
MVSAKLLSTFVSPCAHDSLETLGLMATIISLAHQSINQSINQNAQPAMLAGQLTLTHYHVTPGPRRE